jgi:GT2 family glycosyltransferase
MSAARVHIAMLTHNALQFSEACLHSLIAHGGEGCEIMVLDNASEDGTREWLAARCLPNLHVMLSPINLGVPKGRNRLLAMTLPVTQPEDFIVFMDNDVEVLPGWQTPFVELFAREPAAGIAGVTGHDILVQEDRRELLPSPEAGSVRVDVVSGYCLWVRGSVASALGPFDENLGLFWHEDDDYCVRAIGLGYDVYALPGTNVVHHRHKSGAANEVEMEELSRRNQSYLVAKWRQLDIVDGGGRIVRRAL